MTPLHTFIIGDWWMREAARQPVPPRIMKSVRRILAYLEHEKTDYENTPLSGREGHIFRDVRRLEAWLTHWAGDGSGHEFLAMLETVGTVLLTLETCTQLPQEKLAPILEAHQMHRWGTDPDISGGERNHGVYEAIRDHDGIVDTYHFVRTPAGVVRVTVKTTMTTSTVVHTQPAEWPERPGNHIETYLHEDGSEPLMCSSLTRKEE